MRNDYDIDVEWRGYEIHRDLPPEGMPAATSDEAEEETLRGLIAETGLDRMRQPPVVANSHLALEAAEFAREKGRFEPFHRRLFEAYFFEGKNIGARPVLRDLAREVGLDPEELEKASAEHRYHRKLEQVLLRDRPWYGIIGVPTFVVANQKVVGAQPYEVLREAVRKVRARPRGDRDDAAARA